MNATCLHLSKQIANLEARLTQLRLEPLPAPPGRIAQEAAIQAEINYLAQQMTNMGCFPPPPPIPTIVGTLVDSLTIWTDNSAALGPITGQFSPDPNLVFTQPTSQWQVQINQLSANPGSASVQLQDSQSAYGVFDPSAGSLSFGYVPLQVEIAGHSASFNLPLSTSSSFTPPSGEVISGTNINQEGNLALVGNAQFTIVTVSVEVWVQIVGTLTNWPTKL